MVLVPDKADDEAQRAHREREDLIGERRSIVSKIGGSSQDTGRLFARLLLRGFLALPPGFGKPDGDCLLSALHRFAASAALESTLLAFMHRSRPSSKHRLNISWPPSFTSLLPSTPTLNAFCFSWLRMRLALGMTRGLGGHLPSAKGVPARARRLAAIALEQ
jgi:hypothetical protein